MKESLTVLRKENSSLMMEMIELRNDISLRDEQVPQHCLYHLLSSTDPSHILE